MTNENLGLKKEEWIKPIAYLGENLADIKLIVELPKGDFAFLLPPEYVAGDIISQDTVMSAVSKHGYLPVPINKRLRGREDIRLFLVELSQELVK